MFIPKTTNEVTPQHRFALLYRPRQLSTQRQRAKYYLILYIYYLLFIYLLLLFIYLLWFDVRYSNQYIITYIITTYSALG